MRGIRPKGMRKARSNNAEGQTGGEHEVTHSEAGGRKEALGRPLLAGVVTKCSYYEISTVAHIYPALQHVDSRRRVRWLQTDRQELRRRRSMQRQARASSAAKGR